MTPTDGQNLANLACKYLKYMTRTRTSSGHTSKSYANDLGQFLSPVGVQKILLTSSTQGDSFQIIWKESPVEMHFSGALILQLIRSAQETWGALSAASRNRKAAAVRGFLKWLHAERLEEDDWSPRLVSSKAPQKLPHFISVDEALSLIQSVPEGRGRALILLLYGGGLRVSEACSLKWKDLLRESCSLRVLGKGSRMRIVALPDLAWKSIAALPERGPYI